jgi:acylaminoacyl-peptidase
MLTMRRKNDMESLLYSPDGKYLVFISAKSAIDSGTHNATNSMHKIDWPADGKLEGLSVADVVQQCLSFTC